MDTATNSIEVLEKKVTQLEQELHDSVTQISRYKIFYMKYVCLFDTGIFFFEKLLCSSRLQEIERSSKELDSRAAIDRETLEILQSSLIAEKLNTQQMYAILEKLGLSNEILLSLSFDNIIKK